MKFAAPSLAATLLLLSGCSSAPPSAAPSTSPSGNIRRYEMHGKVVSVNTSDKSAKIDAAEIKGWMSAMTMDYPVKEAADLARLAADKSIQATVFVDGDNFWLGEIKDAPASAPQQKKE